MNDNAREKLRILKQNTADKEASASAGLISVNYRPFLRYWLNTAFVDCRELRLYLKDQLPYSPEWARRLLGVQEGQTGAPVSHRILLDKMEIEIQMHLHYVKYRVDGQEVFSPFLPYSKVKKLKAEEFLLLLPMVIPANNRSQALKKHLLELLAKTALPPQDQVMAAEYLSQWQIEDFAMPLTIYRETADTLYCAKWNQNSRIMCVYIEQGQDGMRLLSSQGYDFIEKETQGIVLGKELLDRLIAPPPVDCSCMEKLPETVYVSKPHTPVRVVPSEDITVKALDELLEQYAEGKLDRLEFSFAPSPWELMAEEVEGYPRKRALVFSKQGSAYSCFYFDDTQYIFFALMIRSENVRSLGPFFDSLTHFDIPSQCLFTSVDPIRSNLKEILQGASGGKISMEKNEAAQMSSCVWRAAWGGVLIQNRRVKYNLAKQEVGGFPLERAYNSERQPVKLDQSPDDLNEHPLELEWRTQDGAVGIMQVDGGKETHFTEIMKRFFQGDVVWLRLSWNVSSDKYQAQFAPQFFENVLAHRRGKSMQSHIVLCREQERYTMLCMQDLAEQAEYYVADKRTYMNLKGSKYPKESFMGRTMPAYLIHKSPVALRNRLDLMLEYRECLIPITKRFAEFARENPVNPRNYDAIRAEHVKET